MANSQSKRDNGVAFLVLHIENSKAVYKVAIKISSVRFTPRKTKAEYSQPGGNLSWINNGKQVPE